MNQVPGKDLASNPSYIIDVENVDANGEVHVDDSLTPQPTQNSCGDDSSDSSPFSSGQKIKGNSGKNQKQDAVLELLMKRLKLEEEEKENRRTLLKEAAERDNKFLGILERLANSICENPK